MGETHETYFGKKIAATTYITIQMYSKVCLSCLHFVYNCLFCLFFRCTFVRARRVVHTQTEAMLCGLRLHGPCCRPQRSSSSHVFTIPESTNLRIFSTKLSLFSYKVEVFYTQFMFFVEPSLKSRPRCTCMQSPVVCFGFPSGKPRTS